MIRVEDEDSFPRSFAVRNSKFLEIWDGVKRLRKLSKVQIRSWIVVPIPAGVTHQQARKKVHAMFQRDTRWNVITRIRENEIWMRKERVKV